MLQEVVHFLGKRCPNESKTLIIIKLWCDQLTLFTRKYFFLLNKQSLLNSFKNLLLITIWCWRVKRLSRCSTFLILFFIIVCVVMKLKLHSVDITAIFRWHYDFSLVLFWLYCHMNFCLCHCNFILVLWF